MLDLSSSFPSTKILQLVSLMGAFINLGSLQVLGQIFSPEAGRAFDIEAERWLEKNAGKDRIAILEVIPKTEGVASSPIIREMAESNLHEWLFR